MCMIILDTRKSNERVSKDIFYRSMELNPHGLGIMYPRDDGSLYTWRHLTDFDGLWNRYCSARDAGKLVAVHFRKTTSGDTTLENCHPFRIGGPSGNVALMHNGTITAFNKQAPEGMSDTRYVVDEILSHFPPGFLHSKAFDTLVDRIDFTSRMLFMDGEGYWCIYNPKSQGAFWHYGDKVWFSKGASGTKDYVLHGKLDFIGIDLWDHEKKEWVKRKKETTYQSSPSTTPNGKEWVAGGTKPTKASQVGSKDESEDDEPYDQWLSKKGNSPQPILFDYGLLDPTEVQAAGLVNMGTAIIHNTQLWAARTTDGEYRPAAIPRNGFTTRGILYGYLPPHYQEAQAAMEHFDRQFGVDGDNPEKAQHKVKWMDVIDSKGHTRKCWAYIARMASDAAEIEAPVPFGDWHRWQSSGGTDIPCNSCESPHTFLFDAYRDGQSALVIYCQACETEETLYNSAEIKDSKEDSDGPRLLH